jgi:hypothetical protein
VGSCGVVPPATGAGADRQQKEDPLAVKVKSVEQSKSKWTENAGRAAESYASGALAAADEWVSRTQAAGDTYKAAIQQAGIADRFKAGVRRAGAAQYTKKIAAVGRDRFAPGVAAATDDYAVGVQPYLDTISNLTLPARKIRGDKANYNRVETVGTALNAKRLAMLGMKAAV